MTCKGTCTQYKAKKPVGIGRYASGQKRCQVCELFIHWSGLWCPCCGYRLRGNPRNVTYKEKLKETPFKRGTIVKVYKDLENCKEFEYRVILVEMLDIYATSAKWMVRKFNEYKKNPQCETEERMINIEKKNNKGEYVVLVK